MSEANIEESQNSHGIKMNSSVADNEIQNNLVQTNCDCDSINTDEEEILLEERNCEFLQNSTLQNVPDANIIIQNFKNTLNDNYKIKHSETEKNVDTKGADNNINISSGYFSFCSKDVIKSKTTISSNEPFQFGATLESEDNSPNFQKDILALQESLDDDVLENSADKSPIILISSFENTGEVDEVLIISSEDEADNDHIDEQNNKIDKASKLEAKKPSKLHEPENKVAQPDGSLSTSPSVEVDNIAKNSLKNIKGSHENVNLQNPFRQSLLQENELTISNDVKQKLSKNQRRRRNGKMKRVAKKKANQKENSNNMKISELKIDNSNIQLQIDQQSNKKQKVDEIKCIQKIPVHTTDYRKEKTQSKKKSLKPIKFVSGGITQFSTNSDNIQNHNSFLEINNIENSTDGELDMNTLLSNVGGRILLKMGFEVGKGLGKNLQGITKPIQGYIRKGRGSIGIYGSEMSLPTSYKVVEKQYHILKALGKSQEETKEERQFTPGIYSLVDYTYESETPYYGMESNGYEKAYSNITNFQSFPERNEFFQKKIVSRKTLDKPLPVQILQIIIFGKYQILNNAQLQKLIDNIEDKIYSTANKSSIIHLQFEKFYINKEFLIVQCANEVSHQWLENLILSSSQTLLPDIELDMSTASEHPILYRIEVFIPGKSRRTNEYLQLLDQQNPGLKIAKSKIFRRNDLKSGVELILGIRERTFETLSEKLEMKLHLGLGTIDFNIAEL